MYKIDFLQKKAFKLQASETVDFFKIKILLIYNTLHSVTTKYFTVISVVVVFLGTALLLCKFTVKQGDITMDNGYLKDKRVKIRRVLYRQSIPRSTYD